ncbi:MAG: ATP-binding protein [Gemmatimonadetes bacterium]|nr:ATP-binding protein [Gemmatimonadota bacterium]
MIVRDAASRLIELARLYPVVTVTGARQSGKTTLCRSTFPALPYVSLEPLDTREFARVDPRGFLASYPAGAIIDEVQRAPEFTSYLQAEVDERPTPGRFILTGSQNLAGSASVAQSLAGRTGVLELYPPSWGELQRFASHPTALLEVLWSGAYPRIFDRTIPPQQWLADYVATYVQRDVRQLLNVGDLRAFTNFVRLAAGSTACEINLSRLGGDAGVSHNTVKAWLSVLEASYLFFRLPGWHTNARKQVVKSPKLHVIDSGLACYLLGIRSPEQLQSHPQRGAIFESWVAAELLKQGAHAGSAVSLWHYRDATRLEVDLVIDAPPDVVLVEAKSGATVASDFTDGVERLAHSLEPSMPSGRMRRAVVYGGDAAQRRGATEIVPWRAIDSVDWIRKAGHAP